MKEKIGKNNFKFRFFCRQRLKMVEKNICRNGTNLLYSINMGAATLGSTTLGRMPHRVMTLSPMTLGITRHDTMTFSVMALGRKHLAL